MSKLSKEQKAANIARTGLPNPDYKQPLSMWFFGFVVSLVFVGIILYVGLSANAEKTARQASSPHTTQAGEWMREVSALPASPEREVFISELGVAMSDGTISDEEHTNLSADYQVLTHKAE